MTWAEFERMVENVGDRINPDPSGCWLWTGPCSEMGYAQQGRVLVHRFVYELLKRKKLSREIVLHHECEHRHCVNPQHLTPMSNGDHVSLHAALRRKAVA